MSPVEVMRGRKKRWSQRVRGIGLGLVILAMGVTVFVRAEVPKAKTEQLYEQLDLFSTAMSMIRQEYVEEVDSQKLIYGALKGMLSSLDDYSVFLDPEAYTEMRVETEGEFGGIGIEIGMREGILTVIAPIDDTPAYRVGLKSKDKIVKINGELTRGITLVDAVKKLRGKPGTKVDLTILREAEQKLIDLTITRDIIKVKSVREAKLLEEGIGFLRLSEFQEHTGREFSQAMNQLEKQGVKGLILDLRNNPGGLLNASVEVAEFFLPQGATIVSTKGRKPEQSTAYTAKGDHRLPQYPIVVLVNEGSASASEILAGALRDHKLALLVGTKTYGKGSVQTVIPLKDGSAVRITTSRYFTPNGQAIHEEGLKPDLEIPLVEPPLEEKTPAKPQEVFEQLEPKKHEKLDNQVERAVDLLKGILAYRQMGSTPG